MRKALLILMILFCMFLTAGYAGSAQAQPVFPVAKFSSNLTSGYAPLSVQFTDLSKDTTVWNWEFGDGTTSTEQNPAHVYFLAGIYNVSLTVKNSNGTDSASAIITVLSKQSAGGTKEQSVGEVIEESTSIEDAQVEEFPPVEETQVDISTPIEETQVEESTSIEESQVEESTSTEDTQVEESTPVEDSQVEESTSAEEDYLENYLENYLKKYEREGKIEFNIPEKMKVGESEVLTAYITRNISENISKEVEMNEKVESRNITVTPKMKVTLKGSQGAFTIDPLTDDVQSIIGQRTTIWKWSVTPQKAGKQTLILNVYLVIPSESGETVRYIDELENETKVEVNPTDFFGNNWQWLIGTTVTILLALLGMYAKNKSK